MSAPGRKRIERLLPEDSFAVRLRVLREAKGMGVTELATRSGISQSYVSMVEAGRCGTPTEHILHRMALALGVDSDEFLRSLGVTPTLPPADVCAYLMESPALVAFLREASRAGTGPDTLTKLLEKT